MLRRSASIIILAIFFALFVAPPALAAGGYASVTVPIEDPVYHQLDKLAGFGLIKTMIQGQRPYVRFEIARLIAEAIENYPAFEARYREAGEISTEESGRRLTAKVYVDRLLKQLKVRYRAELIQRGTIEGEVPRFQGRPLDTVRFDYVYLDEPKEAVVSNNGLGGVNANVQNLVENREGRHYQSGSNLALETEHWMRLGRYFALQFQPRFQLQISNPPLQDEDEAFVQRLNGRFTWNKLDIEIGRDAINWGPSEFGGTLFSSNPRPLDMIKISSISPFYYPFFFKKLGQNEMSLVIANLGPEQVFKDSWLVTYKISNKRTEHFELGFSQSLILGGEGSPPLGFGSVITEFFDVTSNDIRATRNSALELIGRIPRLRGLQVYAEINIADLAKNFETTFVDDASYLAGAYLPRLNYKGTFDLRVEYRRLAPRYSRSPLFTDGMTENQLFLGDSLGPDTWAITVRSHYDLNLRNLLSFEFQYARAHQNIYQRIGSDVNRLFESDPQDRFLARFGWKRWILPNLQGKLGISFEQVNNAQFTGGNRFNWMGEAGIVFYLPDSFSVGGASSNGSRAANTQESPLPSPP